jgi:hypothetical protein
MAGELAVLGDLGALGPFFAVRAHPPGASPAPPWRPVSELTGPSRPLRTRIESVRAALATRGGMASGDVDPRVAASAVHLGLVAGMTAPALGAAVLGCPLDMRPGGLWWQDVTGGPVPLSVPLPLSPPEDGCGPAAADWHRRLLDELVAPLTAAIAAEVRVSGRVLWGNVASAVNAAAGQLASRRPDLAPGAWQAAGRLFGSHLLRDERHPPGPAFRRASCCLFYRLAPGSPAAICGDCVLAGRPTR